MSATGLVSNDQLRARFATSLSQMYRKEVPMYSDLVILVQEINQNVYNRSCPEDCEAGRIDVERHGAIRLGTKKELATISRLFRIMGMEAVDYYDLTVAGMPVHATGFRPITQAGIAKNPFRVFTSLLRLDLIFDTELRSHAFEILDKREIFTPKCVELIELYEFQEQFTESAANHLIQQALETFRWHRTSTVALETYRKLAAVHPLIADVVCFRGPHINHLTPRILDIDAAQLLMPLRGMKAKSTIEGPPLRKCPILLRQTSFLALEEPITFIGDAGEEGKHTARFGEIEQRGVALTPKGRELYDKLLKLTEQSFRLHPSDAPPETYQGILEDCFRPFPDDATSLRLEGLAYFRYEVIRQGAVPEDYTIHDLVDLGLVSCKPITYEDFLPVSAAGIFRSNLGPLQKSCYSADSAQRDFEEALGRPVLSSYTIYHDAQDKSIKSCLAELKQSHQPG